MDINKEYEEIREMAARFADSEVAPIADQIDKNKKIPLETIIV